MAAVAPTPVTNGAHESDKEHNAEHSPPRFTAVNGRDIPVSATNGSSTNGAPHGNEDRRDVYEGGWATSGYNTPLSRQDDRPRDGVSAGHDQDDRQSQRSPSTGASTAANKNKRKRSESAERQASPQSKHQGRGLPKSPGHRPDDPGDPQIQGPGTAASLPHPLPDAQAPPANYPRIDSADEVTPASTANPWQDYDSHLISQAQRAQHLDTSDAQLAEALQREAQGQDPAQKGWGAMSRPADSPAEMDQRALSYGPDRPQGSAVQVGPKRKRVFSNRTKTGCMTCRRRKKKCDEQHPACNNCIRGGFLCEGYSSRSTWQKPSSSLKGPIPLQSKEGYPDVTSHYAQEMSPQRHERPPSSAQPVEAGKMRPIVIDDSERAVPQYMTSPTGTGASRGSWSKRSWPGPTGHPAYAPEPIPTKSDYREVPPIHELSREGPPKADYNVVPSIRELSHPKPSMPLFQGVDQRTVHPSPADANSPQAQARMALSIEHQLSTRSVPHEETEKDKMIRGELYRPFDMVLIEERERCKAALWRFNNVSNPLFGISAKEKNRLLREIFIPSSSSATGSPSSGTVARPTGSIGQGAVIEAPFNCHYGYNIHIGEDVMISENCTLIDDCPINIGAHTWIGPNVTILGSMAHANMQERKGCQSRYQGRPVTIEEDCYVGAGCTIYPGVRLRRGAYVAPGEVVKSDIVAYGFQGLKPSYM
ncbi:C6 zinc finger domain protein [Paecilomyces variotii No. 5]|uniref:C6 zinc finger domain protein n=1 Tax=Byssochlamys spectabilis (strain No. 5 / NBRC 109023) TaxID=1356009 RepID=V5G0U9_BYSSN|nr:C6 zinc finger domain protein [Paecilomyces variotii No. 5]